MANRPLIEDDLKKNQRTLGGCVCSFLIWLFPIGLALAIALFFSPNERVKNISEFNNRTIIWEPMGRLEFENHSYSIDVDDKEYQLTKVTIASGLYPTGDTCNKTGDPSIGCIKSEVAYYSMRIPDLSKTFYFDIFDKMTGSIVNGTIPITGSAPFLSKMCFRIRLSQDISILDIPSEWKLRGNPSAAGCEYGNNWSPYYYSSKKPEFITVEIRSFMDPYIAASSLTAGCNEKNSNENCFGVTQHVMKQYGLYAIMGAGAVSVLELIILMSVCCCCRNRLSCLQKDSD